MSQIWMMTEKCIDEITSNMSRNPVPFDCNSCLVRTPADEIDPDEILSPPAVPFCTSNWHPFNQLLLLLLQRPSVGDGRTSCTIHDVRARSTEHMGLYSRTGGLEILS